MADESMTVIYKEVFEEPPPAAGGGGRPASGGGNVFSPAHESIINDVGNFIRQLLPFASTMVFVIQSIRRSKIFSSFMDGFLTVTGAVFDLLLMPLIPILGPALKLLMGVLPLVRTVSEALTEFIKDPAKGIKDIFSGVARFIEGAGQFFQEFFKGGSWESIGQSIGGLLRNYGENLSNLITTVVGIWGDDSKSFWDKVKETAIEVFSFLGDNWESVKKAAVEVWNDIFKMIEESWIGEFIVKLKSDWDKAWAEMEVLIGTIHAKLDLAWVQLQSAFNDMRHTWTYNVQPVFESLKSFWENYLKPAGQKVVDIFNSIYETVQGLLDKLKIENFFKNQVPGSGILPSNPIPIIPGAGALPGLGLFTSIYDVIMSMRSRQVGGYVPETGMYMLHKGEEVIRPLTQNSSSRNVLINNTFNINGLDPLNLGEKIIESLDQEIKRSGEIGW